jgi:hypothetical protein
VRAAALVLAALTLTACESSQQKSARIEKVAKREARQRAASRPLAQRGLSITRESKLVRVGATAVLHSSEGAAAVVSLRNVSATALRDVPIEITVKDAHGATIYTNDTPGLATTLVSVPLLPAHSTSTWIDDQVQTSGVPASVSARVGEGERVSAGIPHLAIEGAHLAEGGAEGSVVNRSSIGQRELVIYAVASRAGTIVAAGRAVIPVAAAGTSTHFQVIFIGDPRGAKLQISVAGAA